MDEINIDFLKRRKKIIEFSVDGDDRVYQITDLHAYKFGNTTITIPTPDIANIFLNSAEKSTILAKDIYKKSIQSILKLKEEVSLDDIQSAQLFNYLEHIQIAIITLYTAIECLVNSLIPEEYVFHEQKNGGSLLMDKNYIERNKSTDFKFSTILPEALNVKSPKDLNNWANFKKLEGIRNNIIHLKTNALSEKDSEKNLMYSLLKPSIFKIIQSTQKLIVEFSTTLEDRHKVPSFNENDAIVRMVFQDWELVEEYFIAKGIFPPLNSDADKEIFQSDRKQTITAFSKVTRIK